MDSAGTSDGISVLSSLTGLARKTLLQIADEVKANHALLNACQRHEFSPISTGRRYRCIECGGEIDRHAFYWHQIGRRG